MKKEKLKELYDKYELSNADFYKHQHYTIITRDGIEKIQAKENIHIDYEPIVTEKDYWAIKAIAIKEDVTIQTFGSAKHGNYKDGNTQTWYIAEMAEKRAMSRAVLKITGFYALGVFSEDESEDFKRKNNDVKPKLTPDHPRWGDAKKAFLDGKKEAVLKRYLISPPHIKMLEQ